MRAIPNFKAATSLVCCLLLAACGVDSTVSEAAPEVIAASERSDVLVSDIDTCLEKPSHSLDEITDPAQHELREAELSECADKLSIDETATDDSGYEVISAASSVGLSRSVTQTWPATIHIPPVGNTYMRYTNPTAHKRIMVDGVGVRKWTLKDGPIDTYVRLPSTGSLVVTLTGKAPSGFSALKVTINGQTQEVTFEDSAIQEMSVGTFEITQAGYNKIEIEGIESSGNTLVDIDSINIGGPAAIASLTGDANGGWDSNYFVATDYYWGQRGPSTHFNYDMSKVSTQNVEWAYNEVTVPVGSDPVGTYYMVNGFAEGYSGIQVNSLTERRILFSVWSPYVTDDPSTIPESQRIRVIAKNPITYSGEFGHEGSGGQTYIKYPWKAGVTYKFLTRIKPNTTDNYTDYSTYFYDPAVNKWTFISTLRRPGIATWYKKFHSFLENFDKTQGALNRKVMYGNQWVRTDTGKLYELTGGTFTTDPTGKSRRRLDYFGSVQDNQFFMSIDGFFNTFTKHNTKFTRPVTGRSPEAEFAKLPVLADASKSPCVAWNSVAAYQGGARVFHNGQAWAAQWWTRHVAPGSSASGANVWRAITDPSCHN